jgi:hypothetical protein
MKLHSLSLLFACLMVFVVPGVAQTDLYDNGPINGNEYAWTVNFGFVVSNTFTVGAGGATVDGLSFGAWLFPGDDIHVGEVSITSSEFGGTTYFDGIVNFTLSNCQANQFGFNVCVETSDNFGPVNLPQGTYWLNLQNFQDVGDPLYWDENSGPSSASQSSVGTIPSEAFTIFGAANGTTATTGTTPEPGSIVLFGSGILGLAGVLRRKLF